MKHFIPTIRRFCAGGVGFVCVQTVLLSAVLLAGVQTARSVNDRSALPTLNDRPRQVGPLYDYPTVVSDQQLSAVLAKLHPRFIEQPTKVNFIDHALRMWDDDAVFADEAVSGTEMLRMLLHHDEFVKVWGSATPLLQRSPHGVAVSTQQGRPSVSHVDHLMGTLAEIGVPLSAGVMTANGVADVRGLLENALLGFRLNQREYEWTTLATAFYATNGRHWFTTEGQRVDFNVLAKRIMRQSQPQGVCYGQHRLYTLTILLRIDDQMREERSDVSKNRDAQGLLDAETRAEVMDYLLGMTGRLFHSQSTAGYWDGNWPDVQSSIPDPETDPLSRRILATGHVLEWWSMAPEELHPPRATIVRAAQWLANEIIEMDEHKVEKNFTFLTHAGRALALWRGCFPAEFERRYRIGDTTASAAMKQMTTDRNNSAPLPTAIKEH
ncbi:hypothetical protein [Stieleria varia]|uniref:Uncharacterized protein n=1 Tax=Stieleria varia TaxID=2528005 RepID=A0A5C6B1R5_9BACT|nr:hypothetical protein [Stieleria varia]TWU06073.1 hypothetical protein Pla52n_17930 [Stieleria varia]